MNTFKKFIDYKGSIIYAKQWRYNVTILYCSSEYLQILPSDNLKYPDFYNRKKDFIDFINQL